MLRQLLTAASRNDRLREAATNVGVARRVVAEYVAGETVADVVGVTADVTATGRYVSVDRLGENPSSLAAAQEAGDRVVY